MKYFFFLLLSIVALSAYSYNLKKKHLNSCNQDSSYVNKHIYFRNADSIKSIEKKNYTLLINYSDGHQFEWGIVGPSGAVHFNFDPRQMTVYFNPSSPKFFHAFPDCKKIGAFRKLSETPIEDFLHSNKTANICPDCMHRDKNIFFISQFILDN
ncbi:MAG: hypothetical protein HDS84_01395 [Bacteroidales bacterium]|nr:hypothetical protein [Bacteroidales bacterium]